MAQRNEYVKGSIVTVRARFDTPGAYQTVLDGGITAVQLTVDVESVAGVPATPFRLLVESEILLVTGIAGSTLTIERAQEGTLAASHGDGLAIGHLQATDPSFLTLTVRGPDGVPTVSGPDPGATPSAPMIRDAVGRYHADLAPDAEGEWSYGWLGTGTAAGAVEGEFRVTTLLTAPTIFLLPEDYDAIRTVLGSEAGEVDLTDEDLERPLFIPQAEQRIKNTISNWATQLTDPDRRFVLRMATAYATAALIAESVAKGGMVGRVYPNTERETFSGLSELLWQRHAEWLAMAEAWDDSPQQRYTLVLSRNSGPTKAGRTELDPNAPPPWAWGWGTTWGGWGR